MSRYCLPFLLALLFVARFDGADDQRSLATAVQAAATDPRGPVPVIDDVTGPALPGLARPGTVDPVIEAQTQARDHESQSPDRLHPWDVDSAPSFPSAPTRYALVQHQVSPTPPFAELLPYYATAPPLS